MSSKEHLSKITWDSMHFVGSNKHKENFQEVMSNETKQEFDDRIIQISITTIKHVVENGKPLIEYCSKYGNTLNDLNHMALFIKDTLPELYLEFIKLDREPSKEFCDYIKQIAQIIKLKGMEFDIYDYYQYTKLVPRSFKNICKRILDEDTYSSIVSVINKFDMYTFIKVDKETELNGLTIVKGREISKEEKEKVFEYLEENNIPYVTYKAAVRKYVAGDEELNEYVNQHKKVKK